MKKELLDGFINRYNSEPEHYLQCGGRFEVLGNHTDHNFGLCIAGTCSLTTNAAVAKRFDSIVSFESKGYMSFEIDLKDLANKLEEKETTQGIIRGIAKYFVDHGWNIGGMNIYCTSNIPRGAGVSSSAAFELLTAQIFNVLFNDGKIQRMDLCKAGHYAEREFFGKKCGLLDQIGVGFGGYTFIDFTDGGEPKVETLKLDTAGYSFLSINTGGSHANLSDLYSAIPDDMLSAARKMGYKYLIEGSEKELVEKKSLLSDIEFTKSLHFYRECDRVKKAKNAIINKDISELITLINESRVSSTELLKNMYVKEIKGSPLEACDIILKASKGKAGVKINGGGFAGSVIALVSNDVLEDVLKAAHKRYGKENVYELNIRDVGPAIID